MAENKVEIIVTAKDRASAELNKVKGGLDVMAKGVSSFRQFATGALGATTAIGALSAGLALAVKHGAEFERSSFTMSKTFGARTAEMTAEAQNMAERMRHYFSLQDVQYAFTKTADSMQRYGIQGQQYLNMVARASDVAAAKGMELKESIDRIESAMRGEAEASEYLGVTLNDTYMQNMAFNGALKASWEKLSDNAKATLRFNELMQQTGKYSGSAAEATNTFSGSLSSLWNTIVDRVGPALSKLTGQLASFVNMANNALKAASLDEQISRNKALIDYADTDPFGAVSQHDIAKARQDLSDLYRAKDEAYSASLANEIRPMSEAEARAVAEADIASRPKAVKPARVRSSASSIAEREAREQERIAEELARARIQWMDMESDAAAQAFEDQKISAEDYYAYARRLADEKYQAQVASIDRETQGNAQLYETERLKYQQEHEATLRKLEADQRQSVAQRLDAEVDALREILDSERISTEERKALGERYLEARKRQIEEEVRAMKAAGMEGGLADSWGSTQMDRVLQDLDGTKSRFEELKGVIQNMAQSASDAIANFVMGTKTDFNGMINSIIADLIRLAAQKAIVEPLFGLFEKLLGGFLGGGIFGSSGGAMSLATAGSTSTATALSSVYGATSTATQSRSGSSSQGASNVTINTHVNVAGGAGGAGGDPEQARALGDQIGRIVAAKIDERLIHAQRDGGILSRRIGVR